MDWQAVLDDDLPAPLATLARESLEAIGRGDVEWFLEHADPAVEIVEPSEFPAPLTYRGHDGLLEALLAWPGAWEHLEIELRRIFAVGDDQIVTVAMHRGRARHVDLEVEAEIVWLVRYRNSLMTRWDMFMNVEAALAAAHRREEA